MVRVRFFAGFRERLEMDALEIELERPMMLREFMEMLTKEHPEIGRLLEDGRATIAVNHEVARMEQVIAGDDEIAIFPPVSGG